MDGQSRLHTSVKAVILKGDKLWYLNKKTILKFPPQSLYTGEKWDNDAWIWMVRISKSLVTVIMPTAQQFTLTDALKNYCLKINSNVNLRAN